MALVVRPGSEGLGLPREAAGMGRVEAGKVATRWGAHFGFRRVRMEVPPRPVAWLGRFGRKLPLDGPNKQRVTDEHVLGHFFFNFHSLKFLLAPPHLV